MDCEVNFGLLKCLFHISIAPNRVLKNGFATGVVNASVQGHLSSDVMRTVISIGMLRQHALVFVDVGLELNELFNLVYYCFSSMSSNATKNL